MNPLRFSSALLFFTACGGGGGGGAPPDASTLPPAQAVCQSIGDYVARCGGGACDQALVADCSKVTGIVSDPFLTSVQSCLASGEQPAACLGRVRGLQPTQAQRDFAREFCSECVLGVSGCEEAFFAAAGEEPADWQVAGLAVLPLGDDLVRDLTTECATGFGCLATFSNCAQRVIAERALPDATIECVLDQVTGQAEIPEPNPACLVPDAGPTPEIDGAMPSVDGGVPGADSGPCDQCGDCPSGTTCIDDATLQCRVCSSVSGAPEGGACTVALDCAGTAACAFGSCSRLCRADADCSGAPNGPSCLFQADMTGIGVCWRAECDPTETDSCASGACAILGFSPESGELITTCADLATLEPGAMCSGDMEELCPSGYACLTASSTCDRLCLDAGDCPGMGSCDTSTPLGFFGGAVVGRCL
jgi:hypothetical protein